MVRTTPIIIFTATTWAVLPSRRRRLFTFQMAESFRWVLPAVTSAWPSTFLKSLHNLAFGGMGIQLVLNSALTMKKLVRGIVEFRQKILPDYREKFARLALQQSPDALFIACSDSRVVPNLFA